MKMRHAVLFSVFCLMGAAGSVFAQGAPPGTNPSGSSNGAPFVVTANNQGVFRLTITPSAYGFGTVYADAIASSGASDSVAITPTGGPTTYVYTKIDAASWTVFSAPPRGNIRIQVTSVTKSGVMDIGDLKIKIPTSSNTSGSPAIAGTGFNALSTTLPIVLINGVVAGGGAGTATGKIDLELSVSDTDGTGLGTWDMVLTATNI